MIYIVFMIFYHFYVFVLIWEILKSKLIISFYFLKKFFIYLFIPSGDFDIDFS
jgi:hypothetical protein